MIFAPFGKLCFASLAFLPIGTALYYLQRVFGLPSFVKAIANVFIFMVFFPFMIAVGFGVGLTVAVAAMIVMFSIAHVQAALYRFAAQRRRAKALRADDSEKSRIGG